MTLVSCVWDKFASACVESFKDDCKSWMFFPCLDIAQIQHSQGRDLRGGGVNRPEEGRLDLAAEEGRSRLRAAVQSRRDAGQHLVVDPLLDPTAAFILNSFFSLNDFPLEPCKLVPRLLELCLGRAEPRGEP